MTEIAHRQLDAEQQARIEALRRRRVEGPAGRRRRHPALGTRIVSTALGGSTLFGIVAGFGLNDGSQVADVAPVTPEGSGAVVVVAGPTATLPTIDPISGAEIVAPSSAPIELRAQPAVRPVDPPSSAPAASTHGSR